jgi:uncharacterized membrane protein YidH (DUF202 family)
MGLLRFQIIGVLILLAGIKVGIWQYAMGLPVLPENMQAGIFQTSMSEVINRTMTSLGVLIMICGVIFILSGFVTFLRYRKENPTPYMEDV